MAVVLEAGDITSKVYLWPPTTPHYLWTTVVAFVSASIIFVLYGPRRRKIAVPEAADNITVSKLFLHPIEVSGTSA